jgi:hypothetical protein
VGSLLHLQDAHERAQMLLPWRVNGTLDDAEAALLDAHLAECAECRADLAAETALRDAVAGMPVPELARPALQPSQAKLRPAARRRFLARPVPLGWALAGSAAAAAAVALFLALPPAERGADDSYQLLGSGDAASGNVIVMFVPDATERDMRAALEQAGGRIVDGPTPSGAYIVRVGPAERPAALERLRRASPVVLAEPVDPAGVP